MKRIVLYGELAKRFGKYHTLAVRNAAEAVRALKANFRDFAPYMGGAHLSGYGFRVFVGGRGLRSLNEVHNPAGERDVIRIVPTILGSKSGWVRIIIGASLIVAGALVTGASFGAAAPLGTVMMSYGASMIIGGVVQLLTKAPATPTSSRGDRRDSYLFNGPENTSAQGRPVPVVYGQMIVGSAVISAEIETYEEA